MEPWFVKSLFGQALQILVSNADWMGWNLFLAIVPLVLSVFLFRHVQFGSTTIAFSPAGLRKRHQSMLWWLGVVVFVAFLPNAPYILTDIIHFISHVQRGASAWLITLVLIPLYVLFLVAGFEAYVLSLINVGYYLNRNGFAQYVLPIEISLHALSAIGIYLGRFLRFNSWDLITRLHSVVQSVVDDLTATEAIIAMIVTFLVVTGLYALVKPLNLALFAYLKKPRRPSRLKRPRLLEG